MNLNIQNVNYTSAVGTDSNQTLTQGQNGQIQISVPANLSSKEAGIALLQALQPGDIFTGEITNITSGQITLALSDTVRVSAVLSDAFSYNIGDTATFAIKDNSGDSIVLKSINRENLKNLMNDQTIQTALKAANISINETTVSLVHNLMKQGLPIDSNTLNQYIRLLANAPSATAEDVVFMTKMGMPVTQENVQALHQYYNYQSGISEHIDMVTDEMSAFVAKSSDLSPAHGANTLNQILTAYSKELTPPEPVSVSLPEQLRGEIADSIRNIIVPLTLAEPDNEQPSAPRVPLENRPVEELVQKLVKGDVPAKEILQDLVKLLDTQVVDKEQLNQFFQGKEFRALLGNFVRQEMFLPPEAITQDNVKKIFAKILDDNDSLSARFSLNEHSDKLLNTLSTSSRDVNFQNQLNQFLSFVQIPVKMTGQNTHGDLYVYNRRKSNATEDDEVTAFLHLDMEHLGPLDVFVKLFQKQVTTNFKVEDEAILNFIESHMDELTKRLNKNGYEVTSDVSISDRDYDFKKDVLEQEFPPVEIKRFSFDVRA